MLWGRKPSPLLYSPVSDEPLVAKNKTGWRFHPDEIGTFSCALHKAPRDRLSPEGVRRAVAERLIRETS